MKEIKNKKKRVIIFIVLIACLFAGISFGYWQIIHTQSERNVIQSGCFETTFDEGDAIGLDNALPISDEEGLSTDPFTFTIKNICSVYARYQVNLEVLGISAPTEAIEPNFVKSILDMTYPNITANHPYLTTEYAEVETTLVGAESSYKLITGGLAPDEYVTYDLKLWLDYAATLDDFPGINEEIEYKFSSKIVIIASPEKNPNTLAVSEDDCPEELDPFLGSTAPITRGVIETITFRNTNVVPGTALGSWTVSDDGSVKAWYTAGDTYGMYDVFIGAKGLVSANPDSSFLFAGMKNLKYIDFKYFDSSTASNMIGMFFETGESNALFEISDISNWNVSKVTDMMGMFSYTGLSSTEFALDLSNWDLSNVTDTSYMFVSTGESNPSFSLGDLSTWKVSKVRDMSNMFKNTGYSNTTFTLGNLSGWNVSNVENMSYMFNGTGKSNLSFTLNLSNWDITRVSTMESMFEANTYLSELRLDNWDLPKAIKVNMFNTANNRPSPNHLKIYVKNSSVQSWIQSDTNLPSNAVVNIIP